MNFHWISYVSSNVQHLRSFIVGTYKRFLWTQGEKSFNSFKTFYLPWIYFVPFYNFTLITFETHIYLIKSEYKTPFSMQRALHHNATICIQVWRLWWVSNRKGFSCCYNGSNNFRLFGTIEKGHWMRTMYIKISPHWHTDHNCYL